MIAMRGRFALLILAGALLAGCASNGVTGAASNTATGSVPAAGSGSPSDPAPATSGSASGSPSASGAPLPGEDATVVVGIGKITVTVYEDYRCPLCKTFHDQVQPTISAALAAGTVKIEYHAVDLIDHTAGGKGSLLAANAASCAFKAAKFQPYREALFAAQPPESDDQFAQPDKLISIAQSVPGLDSPAFEDCVRNQPFAGSIQSTYDATIGAGKFFGTPAVLINDAQWAVPTSGDMLGSFKQALIRAGG